MTVYGHTPRENDVQIKQMLCWVQSVALNMILTISCDQLFVVGLLTWLRHT